ncbi:MAG: septal ring lytic transglycosylase RlpA family protein [Candidatus Omnitrophica bacterium]|nr:septal ring lytic transglycosylase RlpA family protein [Candidatus Omnitrophota bacterium]
MIKIVTVIILVMFVTACFPTERAVSTGLAQAELPMSFETGTASYYSYECAKLPMANGRPFDPEKRTCASWFYDFGTVLAVRSLDTGRVTHVVVTDRGPNKRLVKRGRIIDLSMRAFEDICDLEKGLTRVVVSVKAIR